LQKKSVEETSIKSSPLYESTTQEELAYPLEKNKSQRLSSSSGGREIIEN